MTAFPYRYGTMAIEPLGYGGRMGAHDQGSDRRVERARARIEGIDRALLELYACRRKLFAELWEYKRRQGITLVDPAQERRVVARARALAVDLGLPPEEAEELTRALLASCKRPLPSMAPAATKGPEPSPATATLLPLARRS